MSWLGGKSKRHPAVAAVDDMLGDDGSTTACDPVLASAPAYGPAHAEITVPMQHAMLCHRPSASAGGFPSGSREELPEDTVATAAADTGRTSASDAGVSTSDSVLVAVAELMIDEMLLQPPQPQTQAQSSVCTRLGNQVPARAPEQALPPSEPSGSTQPASDVASEGQRVDWGEVPHTRCQAMVSTIPQEQLEHSSAHVADIGGAQLESASKAARLRQNSSASVVGWLDQSIQHATCLDTAVEAARGLPQAAHMDFHPKPKHAHDAVAERASERGHWAVDGTGAS
eukprot:jgi/Ulvmu1/6467/UM003_0098.1